MSRVRRADDDREPAAFADLAGVGERTAAALEPTELTPADLADGAVSYDRLVDLGVDPAVAGRLRQRYSLPRTRRARRSLSARTAEMDHLGDGERAWIAVSDGDWEDVDVETPELRRIDWASVWTDRERPMPVRAVSAVGPADAAALAEAGVTSVRQLAFAPAGTLAAELDLDVRQVRLWRHEARERRAD